MTEITKELEKRVDDWIAAHRAEMVEEVCRLIRHKSIADDRSEVSPYGQACRDVLDEYLEIGKKHGLSAKNHAYQVGELFCPDWAGKKKRVGLMGHLDVVPTGGGWIYPPFEGIVKDGLIIGRGSQDNKGPSMAAMYTVLCLRDLGIEPQYDVCALAGTDEESGMADARYFSQHGTPPDLILVTDSGFPVCYGERPVISGTITAHRPFSKIRLLHSVNIPGLVPCHAEAVVEKSDRLLTRLNALPEISEGCGWKEQEDGILLWADSISGHFSFANAQIGVIAKLIHFMLDCDLTPDENDREILSFAGKLVDSPNGAALSIDCADEESGEMKFGCSSLQLTEGKLRLGFSARCPITIDCAGVFSTLKESCAKAGFTAEQTRFLKENYFPKDTPVITTLSRVFQETTGLDWTPQVFSAGTHARQLPCAVAFGPGGLAGNCVPDSDLLPNGHGGAHQPDEAQSIDALCLALKVYVLSVIALDGKPLGKEGK